MQSYDLEAILQQNLDCKLKGSFMMLSPKLIQHNENVTSIGCILARLGTDTKKKGGALAVLRFSGPNNDLEVLLIS